MERILAGKSALVTGASRGIGRAVALKLASLGAKVAINFAGNIAKATEVKAEIDANGGESILVQGNVADFETVQSIVKSVTENFGKIDILVNNAGITRDNLLIKMSESDFDEVVATNLKGVFNCTKAVTRMMMKQRGGRIVNMSSVVDNRKHKSSELCGGEGRNYRLYKIFCQRACLQKYYG